MLLLWAITPVDAGSIENHLLETPACARTLTVLANLLDQEEDEDTWHIPYEKFIYSSLAIAVIAKAANKVIKAQKRKEINTRKVIRAYNKANRIVVQRGPYKKKQ